MMREVKSLLHSFLLPSCVVLACTRTESSPATRAPVDAKSSAAPRSFAPTNAQRTASGLRLVIVKGGGPGDPPRLFDRVVVRYSVRDEGGEIMAGTVQDESATLEMKSLPPGWAEGMTLLVPGDRATLWVPEALGYSEDGPRGALTIEVELVDILRGLEVAELPIVAPPPDAKRTASGIAYVVIRAGTGTDHPGNEHRITAHYAGWTTDGKPFDSSYERGKPIEFEPTQVIPGWTEALKLMVVGEKTRFWIPEALAYKGKPGRPKGMLVFDIELIAFERAP
jgi:peptidylprolyl isomerase